MPRNEKLESDDFSRKLTTPTATRGDHLMIQTFSMLLCLMLITGCGLPYMHEYRAEVTRYEQSGAVVPTGPWRGSWQSNMNQHTGPLWCFIHPVPKTTDQYDFRYRAGWGILRFGNYTHRVTGDHNDASFHFSGTMELPANFGTYHVKGTITDQSFHAHYRSERGDHGSMQLTRP